MSERRAHDSQLRTYSRLTTHDFPNLRNRSQLGDPLFDLGDQRSHLGRVEDERGASGLVDLGERPRAAEGQRRLVLAERARGVAPARAPDLQRGELREAVLDVIEGRGVDVTLTVPARDALGL